MLYQRICIPLRNFKAGASGFEDVALQRLPCWRGGL
jgi:hypothetical protein